MKIFYLSLLLILFSKLAFSQNTVWGESNSRTETREDAGLQGNAGAISGFYQTEQPLNFPAGAQSWWHLLDVRHSNPENNFAMQFAGSFFDQELFFRKTNDNASQPWAKVLLENGGKVGIGTNTPTSQLHLIGSDVEGGMVNVQNTSPNFYSGMNMFNENGELAGSFQVGNSQTGGLSNSFFFGNRLSGSTVIISGLYANPLATFLSNGNVGIGNTDPQNKLDVNGTIHSRQVNVDANGWPDYVFKPSYRAMELSEVGKYLKKNHHLPEIPSAAQIEKEGLNLGEMNAKLLKKVEELTLYLLDQDKTNKAQQFENFKQQSEINMLKAQVRSLAKSVTKRKS